MKGLCKMRFATTVFLMLACSPWPAALFTTAYAQESSVKQAQDRITHLTNELRASAGLKELSKNDSLNKAATDFAHFMLAESKYGHRADGRRPAERAEIAGYDYCVVRENIAYRVDPDRPDASAVAQDFFDGWKESEGHRENMLGEHISETGVAVVSNDGVTFYAVQMFGRPASAKFKIQIKNETNSTQVLLFSTEDSRDEISIPPKILLSLSRCIATSISLQSSDTALDVKESGQFAITAGPGGDVVLGKQ